MEMFKKGAIVRLKQPEIAGVIMGGKLAESGDSVDYVMAYTDASGEPRLRHFSAADLEEVTDPEAIKAIEARHAKHAESIAENAADDLAAAEKHAKEAK